LLQAVEFAGKTNYNNVRSSHAGVAELADALDLGSSGAHPWRFKSSRPHHISFSYNEMSINRFSIFNPPHNIFLKNPLEGLHKANGRTTN
jgi:hypothetical protein